MLLTVIFSLLLGLAIVAAIVTPVVRGVAIASELDRSVDSYYLAEAAVEDAIYRLKNGHQVSDGDELAINGRVATIMVEDLSFNGGKRVSVSGDWDEAVRNVEVELLISEGADFNYGVQAGNEGFDITGGSIINGNVYSNGNITGKSGTITGAAIAAGGAKVEGTNGNNNNQPLVVGGDVWANEVNYVDVGGSLYCQIGAGNAPSQPCNSTNGVPPLVEFPITEDQILTWKTQAEDGGVTIGNVNVGSTGLTLGPQKITGDLTISGGGTLTLTGAVWVEGEIRVSGGGKVSLDSSYGNESEVLLADDLIHITGNGQFAGSGEAGSYPVLISTSDCPNGPSCGGDDHALYISGGSGAVVLVAQNGTLHLQGGSAARSIIGRRISVSGGGQIDYDAGLVDLLFSSGPGGSFSINKWQEVE